jgi:hypothetical protein
MAIIVKTSDPAGLLKAIYKAIDDKKVVTWLYEDQSGQRFLTHTPEQWIRKAWLKAIIPTDTKDELHFVIRKTKASAVTRVVYGVYHGRFIEMLLNHFDQSFDNASATALASPSLGDYISND